MPRGELRPDIEGYKFLEPTDVEPSDDDMGSAAAFLAEAGFDPSAEHFAEGSRLVAEMLALGKAALEEAPMGWRYAADLDAPDGRCVVMLSQRQTRGVVKDLLIVESLEASKQVREAFMQQVDQPA